MEKIVRGVFQGTAQGFGFVRISEDEELFIPPNTVHGALPRDTLECRITVEARKDSNAAAEVIRILEHGLSRIPGNMEYGGWIVPDNPAIHEPMKAVPPEEGEAVHAAAGHKVIARIVRWPEEGGLQAVIEEDLGEAYAPTARIRAVLCVHELPVDFPQEVLAETDSLSDTLEVSAQEQVLREDLRDVPMVTIDGEDARDLDDAVSLTRTEDGKNWILGVHIADVANYVQERSASLLIIVSCGVPWIFASSF